MTLDPIPAYVQKAKEAEQQTVENAKAAVAQESHNKFEIGRLACEWTQKYANGRTDADFAELVGGLTRSQVQQRRQVIEKYGDVCHTYGKLSWSHFYVAIDWSDAEEWLAEADKHGWSVATMKRKREEAGRDGSADSESKLDSKPCSYQESSAVTEPDREKQGQPTSAPVAKPALVPVQPKKKPRKPVVDDAPKRSESERLHVNVSLHLSSTVASLQRDFVDADKLLERHEKPGFDRVAAIKLTKQLNGVLLDLQGRVNKCR